MRGTLKLKKTMSPSANALAAFREGKYFACQIEIIDRLGMRVPKNTTEGRELYKQLSADLTMAAVKSTDERTRNLSGNKNARMQAEPGAASRKRDQLDWSITSRRRI